MEPKNGPCHVLEATQINASINKMKIHLKFAIGEKEGIRQQQGSKVGIRKKKWGKPTLDSEELKTD